MGYLKEKTVRVESLGDSMLIRELPAVAQIQIMEASEKPFEGIFIACSYGVVDWLGKTVDEIKSMVSLTQASDIASQVFELSGGSDAGN